MDEREREKERKREREKERESESERERERVEVVCFSIRSLNVDATIFFCFKIYFSEF